MHAIRVVAIEPERVVADIASQLSGVSVQWESDLGRAMEHLANAEHDVGLVAGDLGDGQAAGGPDFVRKAVDAGCVLPLILVSPEADDDARQAALRAGADMLVDLSAGPTALEWAIRFAHASRVNRETHHQRLLQGVASFLAHEGKNALAGIGGAVQVISDRMACGSAEQLISGEIQDRLRALGTTIEVLTFVLRPPTGHSRAPVGVRTLIQSAAAQTPDTKVEISGEDMQIRGDKGLLQRLFEALIENAEEASAGQGSVDISIGRAGPDCVVAVAGREASCVEPADLTSMLEPFYSTKPHRVGLGLPVAKRIAEVHRGTLRLSREAGRGVCVTLRLPIDPQWVKRPATA